ncbi:uncharacterized protein LOC135462462 [Liolophura sinensis]|uniref:uncharacterized protein LOC135462462 n=1 Tax=Liolophura sinensis TaxID=3198878 RepID=UPI0031590D7E
MDKYASSSFGEPCGTDNGQCTGLNVECNDTTDGYCVCGQNTELSSSGTDCNVIGEGRLGDTCTSDSDCFIELFCNGTTCDCRSGFRPVTPEEKQAYVDYPLQCRPDTFDLNFCPTTEAPTTTTSAATTTPTLTTEVQTTVTLAPASLFTSCSDDSQCPVSASCRQRECDGQICLCVIGYVPNDNDNGCLTASSFGERCGTDNGQCTGLNVECNDTTDGYCVCGQNTELSSSGTDCNVIGEGRLGDTCTSDSDCFIELFCNGTTCDCRSGFRPVTPEERQAYVDYPLQCRPDMFDLNFCPTTEAPTTTTSAATTTPTLTTEVQTTVTLAPASLFTSCSDDSQCPVSASCRQRECDGQICLCVIGYVPNDSDNGCLTASSFGEPCGTDNGQCTGLNVECNDTTDGYCVCGQNTELSSSGTDCNVIGEGRLGDTCTSDSDCFIELFCNGTTCDCRSGFRPVTPEERQAYVDYPLQCRPDTFDLNFCPTTEAPTTTTSAATTTPTLTTEVQTTVTLAPASLFTSCSDDSQCPVSASCRQRECDGQICLCVIGYVPNDNDNGCLTASSFGERCGTDNGQCTGLNVECNDTTDGYCVCGQNTELSSSGTDCNVIGEGRLGDTCTSDSDCFIELFCNGTTCDCRSGFRPVTPEERQAYVDYPLQCRPDMFDLNFCPTTEAPTTTTSAATTTPTLTTEVQTTVTLAPASLFTSCSDDSQCPVSASCRQRECDGQICLCVIGYVPNDSDNGCLTASSFGEPCGTDNGQCTGLNVECNDTTDGYCVCGQNTELSSSGTDCNVIGEGRLGDTCTSDSDCFIELFCNGTTCDCRSGFRPVTPEEKQAYVDYPLQCRPDTFDLNFCPTTEAPTTTTSAATTTPTLTTEVQTTVTLAPASLFTSCSDDSQCPVSASCRQRECDGQICLCVIGYVPNDNDNGCLTASSFGERCGTDNGQCTGLNVECNDTTDGYCVCGQNTELSSSGTDCNVIGEGRLGDTCTSDSDCFIELFCNGTTCDCRSGFRPVTPEERQAYVDYPLQCRPDMFDLNFCPTTEAPTTTTSAATTTPTLTTEVQTTVTLAPASLFTSCSDDSQCPVSASCRQRECDGQICLCVIGYVPNDSDNGCLTASSFGEPCGTDNGQCTGLNVECNDTTDGYCVCGQNTELSSSGTDCNVIGEGRLGDTCTSDSDCFIELFCNGTTCDCRSGFRPVTPEERQAYVDYPLQCRPDTFDLNFCPTTEAPTTTTSAATTTPTLTTEVQTTVTLAPASLFTSCSDDSQCPVSASCRQRECDGQICLCVIGYVPNDNDNGCLTASSFGERCGTDNGQCTGLNVECNDTTDGYCVCGQNTELSSSGTDCNVIGEGRLGDTCTSDSDCFIELFCNGTTCDCRSGFRPVTPEERFLPNNRSAYNYNERSNNNAHTDNRGADYRYTSPSQFIYLVL